MTAQEKLAEVQLAERGIIKVVCPDCHGVGYNVGNIATLSHWYIPISQCFRCNGGGIVWSTPIVSTNLAPSTTVGRAETIQSPSPNPAAQGQ